MKVLSLFDGISCGRIALQRAGINVESYYASEIDRYAIQISENNWPDIVHIGDVCKVSYSDGILHVEDTDYWIETDIDMVMMGSPCQSFTFAGKRQGMSTTDNIEVTTIDEYLRYKSEGYEFSGESYLFWEAARILREVKPKYFLLENVKMENKWRDIISRELGVEPVLINSADFSAQHRLRYYWTNFDIPEITEYNDTNLWDIRDSETGENYPLSKTHYEAFLKSYPNWKPCEWERKSKPLLASYYKQPPHCPYVPSDKSESGYRRLSPLECERLQTLPDNYTAGVSDTQRYKTIGNGWTVDVIAHILKSLE